MVEVLVAPRKPVYDRIINMLRWYESSLYAKQEKRERPQNPMPQLAVLLDRVESLGSGRALILTKSTATQVYMLSLLGQIYEPAVEDYSIQLAVNGINATTITASATRKQLRDALLATGEIQPNEIRVALGNDTDFSAYRWFIELNLTSSRAVAITATSSNGLTRATLSQPSYMATNSEIEVNALLPFGSPTPLRPGVIVTTKWIQTHGHVIDAAEPRVFDSCLSFPEA